MTRLEQREAIGVTDVFELIKTAKSIINNDSDIQYDKQLILDQLILVYTTWSNCTHTPVFDKLVKNMIVYCVAKLTNEFTIYSESLIIHNMRYDYDNIRT